MDAKNFKDLQKIVAYCRKQGIQRIKTTEIELELAPASLFPISAYKKTKESAEEIKTENAYSDIDLINWSSSSISEEITTKDIQ